MLVFLKTYEEANCTAPTNNDCDYTFTSILPNVTAVNAVFDDTLYEYSIKLSGTNFTGDTSNVELMYGSVKL